MAHSEQFEKEEWTVNEAGQTGIGQIPTIEAFENLTEFWNHLKEENNRFRISLDLATQQIKELLQQKELLSRRELEARTRCECAEEMCEKFFDKMLNRMQ